MLFAKERYKSGGSSPSPGTVIIARVCHEVNIHEAGAGGRDIVETWSGTKPKYKDNFFVFCNFYS